MPTTDLLPESVLAADQAIAEGQPVFMLNLLRYREHADYGDGPGGTPCSGREAYHQRYVPAFGAVAVAGIRVFWVGTAVAQLVGPRDEHWHEVAIVEYPSFQVFRQVVESPRYLAEAAPHRRAALADWRLISMAKLALG